MSLQKEPSRTLSRNSGSTTTKRDSTSAARPSMFSKAYNTVSFRGTKVGGGVRNSFIGGGGGGKYDAAVEPKVLHSFSGVFPTPVPGCRPSPPAPLTDEQTAKYEQALKYFTNLADYPVSLRVDDKRREPVSDWEKCRMLTRESILRYLRASKWDVAVAQRRLVETVAWRREFGVDSLDADEMAKEAKSGKETVLGYDNSARPLHYMHPHRNDTKESPRQMQYAVWILEAAIDLMPPGVEQLALLINFEHRSRNPTSIANAKLMLDILQNRYVERLGVAMCINVPWVFKMFWNAIQAFIDPVTKSKCKFDEAIKSEVPLEQLADDFGGELDAKYNHDAYWPQLVELCQQRRRAMLARFTKDCNSEIGASEWVIRGGDDETSPFNAKDREALAGLFPGSKPSSPNGEKEANPNEARQQAIDSSEKRTADATSNGNADVSSSDDAPAVPLTPMESYKTPADSITSNPLDRTFSNVSAHAALAAGVAGGTPLQIAAASRESQAETEGKQGQKKKPSMEQEIKHLRDKMHDSKAWQDITKPFHPRSSGESKRKGSGEQKRRGSKDINRQASLEAGDKPAVPEGMAAGSAAAIGAGTAAAGSVAAVNGINGDHKVPDSAKKPIKVLFFAAAKDAAGARSESVEVPSDSFNLLKLGNALVEKRREAGSKSDADALEGVIRRSKWSVDQAMVDEEDVEKMVLKGGEEVGLIPPVSGG